MITSKIYKLNNYMSSEMERGKHKIFESHSPFSISIRIVRQIGRNEILIKKDNGRCWARLFTDGIV